MPGSLVGLAQVGAAEEKEEKLVVEPAPSRVGERYPGLRSVLHLAKLPRILA